MVPRIIAAVVTLLSAPVLWAIDDSVDVVNSQPVTESFVHLLIEGQTPRGSNAVELSAWTFDPPDLNLFVDWNVGDTQEAAAYRQHYSIPNPGHGTYTIRYHARLTPDASFELRDSVEVSLRPGWPENLPVAFIWPAEPTPLDDVAFYLVPRRHCEKPDVSNVTTNAAAEGKVDFRDSIVISREFAGAACDRARVASLARVALGGLESGLHELKVREVTVMDSKLSPMPPDQSVDLRRFTVHPVLPGRLSGSWYNPDQSGHGLSLEVVEGGERLLAYWFTFDDLGNQAWIIGDGTVDESGTSVTMDATLHTGGRFPPDFDPEDVEGTPWGTMTLAFEDCSNGTLSWDSELAGFSDGEMPVERLSTISGFGCTTPPPDSLLDNTWRLTPYPVVEESAEPPEGAGG
jgi:hypothetical protein